LTYIDIGRQHRAFVLLDCCNFTIKPWHILT